MITSRKAKMMSYHGHYRTRTLIWHSSNCLTALQMQSISFICVIY